MVHFPCVWGSRAPNPRLADAENLEQLNLPG